MLFSYIGPETMMPVASVLVAIGGVFMMFGRSVVGFGRGLVRRVWPGSATRSVIKSSPESPAQAPVPDTSGTPQSGAL